MRALGLALNAAKLAAMMEAQAIFAQSMRFAEGLPRGSRRYRKTTLHAINGKRECARRLRQIAAGSLRAENGLAV